MELTSLKFGVSEKETSGYARYHFKKDQLKSLIDNWDSEAGFTPITESTKPVETGKHHPTATARQEAAAPLRDYVDTHPVLGKRILYHGVGRDLAGAKLLARGDANDVEVYDPHHPDEAVRAEPKGKYDQIHSHYTLNVVDPDEGKKVLTHIHSKLRNGGEAIVSVRRDLPLGKLLKAEDDGPVGLHPNVYATDEQLKGKTWNDVKDHRYLGDYLKERRWNDDTFPNKHLIDGHLDEVVKHPNEEVAHSVLLHPDHTADHLTTLMGRNDTYLKSVLQSPHINESHLTQAMNHQSNYGPYYALGHPKVNKSHLMGALKRTEHWEGMMGDVVNHPKADADVITAAIDHVGNKEDQYSHRSSIGTISSATHFGPKHIDQIINHPNLGNTVDLAAVHPKGNPAHLQAAWDKAKKEDNYDVKSRLLDSHAATDGMIDDAMQDTALHSKLAVHPKLSAKHIDTILDRGNSTLTNRVMNPHNPNVTPEHINRALSFSSKLDVNGWEKKEIAGKAYAHPNATEAQVDEGLANGHAVRMLSTGAIKDRHLADILSSGKKYPHIAKADAAEHSAASGDTLSIALKSDDYNIRRRAIKNPNATSKNIHEALDLDSQDNHLSELAMNHPNATDEHYKRGLSHPSEETRKLAREKMAIGSPDSQSTHKVTVNHFKEPLREIRSKFEEPNLFNQKPGPIHKRDFKSKGINEARVSHLLDAKGNLHSDAITKEIESGPKSEYGVSHSFYDSEAQNHAGDDSEQKVFQLNYTGEHVKRMKEAGVFGDFKKIKSSSYNNGHPANPATLGWVRHTGDAKGGRFIDEAQSDFGQKLTRSMRDPEVKPETREAHTKIHNILFGGHNPGTVIHEAFRQHLRDQGEHGTKVNMATTALKVHGGSIEGGRPAPGHQIHTYETDPKKMGYGKGVYGGTASETNKDFKANNIPVNTSILHKRDRLKAMVDLIKGLVK